MKIGIYDSGIGGLSVLHRALKKMPEAEFIYYADTKHVPYGEKTREQIKGYVEEVLNFLIAKEVDAIVIACNTATSVATKEFRGEFAVPIVGMEPAVKRALKLYQDMQKRILVTATPVTIAGEKLHSLLEKVDTEHEVDLAPLPKLVRFAEAGRFQDPEVDKYLKNSKRETCMGSPIPFNQVRRLKQRSDKINTLFKQDKYAYKRAIFVHVDSRNKGHQTDVFFYHQNKNSESKHLAKTMRTTFTHKYKKHQPGRGFTGTVDGRNLYVLRHTTPASVFVELGNIQNSFDQQRIILSDNRQALANWLCEGFVTDYNRYRKKTR